MQKYRVKFWLPSYNSKNMEFVFKIPLSDSRIQVTDIHASHRFQPKTTRQEPASHKTTQIREWKQQKNIDLSIRENLEGMNKDFREKKNDAALNFNEEKIQVKKTTSGNEWTAKTLPQIKIIRIIHNLNDYECWIGIEENFEPEEMRWRFKTERKTLTPSLFCSLFLVTYTNLNPRRLGLYKGPHFIYTP